MIRYAIPTLLAWGALVSAAAAAGIAVVVNSSPDPIYVWSVGGSVGPRQYIKAGEFALFNVLLFTEHCRWHLLGIDAP